MSMVLIHVHGKGRQVKKYSTANLLLDPVDLACIYRSKFLHEMCPRLEEHVCIPERMSPRLLLDWVTAH